MKVGTLVMGLGEEVDVNGYREFPIFGVITKEYAGKYYVEWTDNFSAWFTASQLQPYVKALEQAYNK